MLVDPSSNKIKVIGMCSCMYIDGILSDLISKVVRSLLPKHNLFCPGTKTFI